MKVVDLLTTWKPKKAKKLKAPSGFWLVGLAGPGLPSSGEGGEGGGMSESLEDDWEPEEEQAEWRSFKVVPREETDGWKNFQVTAKIYDDAFGQGNWGQSGVQNTGTFLPMKISLRPGTKINYGPLRDNGLKILFLENDITRQKYYRVEDLPNEFHIAKSFYAERVHGKPWATYEIKQWLSDEVFGTLTLFSTDKQSWDFKLENDPGGVGDRFVFVDQNQVYNTDLVKIWVHNHLISAGMVPHPSIREDIDDEFEERRATNFGFHPSRKQFWFSIADMDLFLQGQNEWLATGHRQSDKKPNASYVEWLLNNEIMVQKDAKAWREDLAVVLKWGALRGNRPATDQMVFMFDPKQSAPSTKKMREFGLQPDFTYMGEGRAF